MKFPSFDSSQKHIPAILTAQSVFRIRWQLTMNLKFLFNSMMLFNTYLIYGFYCTADLVGEGLSLSRPVIPPFYE